ncbi:MAG: type II secretion system F family protein [Acidobacteriota bacterium]|nr:type II secretion system F family protein [Acidobacteriota bacterium]
MFFEDFALFPRVFNFGSVLTMEFVCKVATASGQVLSQTERADSEAEVRRTLAAKGYYIFSVRPKDWLGAQFGSLGQKKIRPDDFIIFNQQFLTLSRSGLPLETSLGLLARQARHPALKRSLERVQSEVRGGALLSDAFDSTSSFPRIYAATLRAGERSGSLDKVLAQFLSYQRISRNFRKKILAALIYPAFLVLFLIILVAFVVSFIVPRFAELYSDLSIKLPHLTSVVISLSLGARHWSLEVVLVLILCALALRMAWRAPGFRMAWDRVKFRLPIVGSLLLKFSVAEFARSLGTLLQGGLPIIEALETARASITSPLIAKAVDDATRDVSGGRSLGASLRATRIFPPTALDMVEVGEATGALPAMLESVAEFYEEDVNIDMAALVSLIDPVMISGVAIVVAFVVVAFYLPLFSLYSQVP